MNPSENKAPASSRSSRGGSSRGRGAGHAHHRSRSDPYPTGRADDGAQYVEPSRPLNRGAACLPCRRKRAKCDAARPVCSRCAKSRAGQQEVCEYEEPPKSHGTLLQERLEQIETSNAALNSKLQQLMDHGGLSISAAMALVAGSASNSNPGIAGPPSVLQSHPGGNENVDQLQLELLRNQPSTSQHDPNQIPSSSSQHALSSFQMDNYEPQPVEAPGTRAFSDPSHDQGSAVPEFTPQRAIGRGRGTGRAARRGKKRGAEPAPSAGGLSVEVQRSIVAPQSQYPLGELSRSISDPYPPQTTGFPIDSHIFPEFLPHASSDATRTGTIVQFGDVDFHHPAAHSIPEFAPVPQEQMAFSITSSTSTGPDSAGLTYDPSVSFSSSTAQTPDSAYPAPSQSGQAVAFSPSSSRPPMRHHNTALPTIQDLMHFRQENNNDPAAPAPSVPPHHQQQQQAEQGMYQLAPQSETNLSGLVESRRPSLNTVLNSFAGYLDSSSVGQAQAQSSIPPLGLTPVGQGPINIPQPLPLPAWQPNPLLPLIPEHEHSPSPYSLLHGYNNPQQIIPNAIIPYEVRPVERATLAYDPTWMNGDAPTPEFESKLIQTFLAHRRQCASEFNIFKFLLSMQNTQSSTKRPHPCLVNAMFLLACWFNQPYDLRPLEEIFLEKARVGLSRSLQGLDKLLDFIRASSLIGLYHYGKGNMLEGYDHICSAAQIGRACGIDAIKSHVWRDPTIPSQITRRYFENLPGNFKVTPFIIPLAEDATALGERIHAFWSVWIVDASGSATHGLARAFDDEDVLTPLPYPIEAYDGGGVTEDNTRTLGQFWREEGYADSLDPPFTHRIKATSVLEAACTLSRVYGVPAMGDVWSNQPALPIDPLQQPEFEEKFSRIARICNNLRDRLPNVLPINLTNQDVVQDWYQAGIDPVMVHAWGLTLCTIMTLNDIKARVNTSAYDLALDAAYQMVLVIRRIVDLDFFQLDIMLGMSWVTTSHILIRHARALQNMGHSTDTVLQEIQIVIFTLHKLGKVFPLVGIQANTAEAELRELHL